MFGEDKNQSGSIDTVSTYGFYANQIKKKKKKDVVTE